MLLTNTEQLFSKRQNVIHREADFTGQTGTRAG